MKVYQVHEQRCREFGTSDVLGGTAGHSSKNRYCPDRFGTVDRYALELGHNQLRQSCSQLQVGHNQLQQSDNQVEVGHD